LNSIKKERYNNQKKKKEKKKKRRKEKQNNTILTESSMETIDTVTSETITILNTDTTILARS